MILDGFWCLDEGTKQRLTCETQIANLLSQNNHLTPSLRIQSPITTTLPYLEDPEDSHPQTWTSTSDSSSFTGFSDTLDIWRSLTPHTNWETYFPSYEEGRILHYHYFTSVDPLAHVVHRPSFEIEAYNMSLHAQDLRALPASFRALLLAVCFAAAVSMSEEESQSLLGIQKRKLVSKLELAAEKALVEANYLTATEMQTLQAFTIFLVSLLEAKCPPNRS